MDLSLPYPKPLTVDAHLFITVNSGSSTWKSEAMNVCLKKMGEREGGI